MKALLDAIEAELHEIGNAYPPALYFAERLRDEQGGAWSERICDALRRIAAAHERLKALHREQTSLDTHPETE